MKSICTNVWRVKGKTVETRITWDSQC